MFCAKILYKKKRSSEIPRYPLNLYGVSMNWRCFYEVDQKKLILGTFATPSFYVAGHA
jgi:hypothetical protein